MTANEFKQQVRLKRGQLKDMDSQLEDIFNNSIPEIIDFALRKKLLGIDNLHELSKLSPDKQLIMAEWYADKNWKATKQEVELKYLSLR